jgi:hypothetical protein
VATLSQNLVSCREAGARISGANFRESVMEIAVMERALKRCIDIFRDAIEGASDERANIERENERLRAALTFAIGHCTGTYFLTSESDLAGDLLDIDPMAILTSRYVEVL